MLFTERKLYERVMELGGKRYFGHTSIAPFTSMEEPAKEESNLHIPDKIEGPEFQLNEFFVGWNRYLWLDKTIALPEVKEGCKVVGLFDFGKAGSDGFESMLYVDEQPYQGVDKNHKEVDFSGFEGKDVRLTFMLWTGLAYTGPQNAYYYQFKQADIAYLHEKADELYFYGNAIFESLKAMDKSAEQYHNLMTALDRALHVIDWDGEDFYATVEEAHAILMRELGKLEKHSDITVNVMGHTHIDVAWLWRLKHTKEKAQRSFSTVLRLMEQYPEYIFQQAQPQLYQYMKDNCPEIYAKIKERVVEGRWEADGGMWVEADCNISSGEALARQFLHGTRFFEREFGKKCTYLWLPDVFGYSWALPQILKQCEIDTFMTTKISWNQYNHMPHDLFTWRGMDGTEMLTYFITAPLPGFWDGFGTYNGNTYPQTVMGTWEQFQDKDLSRDVLISYGHGDGGGGPTREMLEYVRVIDRLPGLPNVKQCKGGDFFKRIHESVENTDRYVHVWDGELYLEAHRGTYTTQGYNKKMNRYLENKLAQVEWLSSLAYLQKGVYEQDRLHEAWECVLLHQFHDIIPGSSITEVYDDSRVNYAKAEKTTDVAKVSALNVLCEKENHVYSIYSSNSFGGKELVLIPEHAAGVFTDEAGRILDAQKCDDGYEVLVDVKPFAVVQVSFTPAEGLELAIPFSVEHHSLETPYYSIAWNDEGHLIKIYDKEADRHVLREGQEGNVLEIFEDKPYDSDAWNVEIYAYEKMNQINATKPAELVECGPLKAVVRFYYQYHLSSFSQDMIVYRDSKRIDFKTHADWHETHKLLKVAFHTDIRATKATYDIQYGHLERPTHWNNSWDWAKFEVCAHKWADFSEHGYGVSLLNDCKYGYSIKDNVMRLSLLRSPKAPDAQADMGEHDFVYSLYPHMGSVTEGGTIEEANKLNLPAQVLEGVFADKRNIINLSSSCVQIDAVKKAEDEECLVIRMHECRGGSAKVQFSSDYAIQKIVPCNILEHDCGEAVSGSQMDLSFKPFEIKSFKLYL